MVVKGVQLEALEIPFNHLHNRCGVGWMPGFPDQITDALGAWLLLLRTGACTLASSLSHMPVLRPPAKPAVGISTGHFSAGRIPCTSLWL